MKQISRKLSVWTKLNMIRHNQDRPKYKLERYISPLCDLGVVQGFKTVYKTTHMFCDYLNTMIYI